MTDGDGRFVTDGRIGADGDPDNHSGRDETSSSLPWQYKWKRPELHVPSSPPEDDDDGGAVDAADAVVVSTSSALLTRAEARSLLSGLLLDDGNAPERQWIAATEAAAWSDPEDGGGGGVGSMKWEDLQLSVETTSLSARQEAEREEVERGMVLTVTILSSPRVAERESIAGGGPRVGDALLLELLTAASDSSDDGAGDGDSGVEGGRRLDGTSSGAEEGGTNYGDDEVGGGEEGGPEHGKREVGVRLLFSQTLRWPSAALLSSSFGTPLSGGRTRRRRRRQSARTIGLPSSACLCRRRHRAAGTSEEGPSAADALDVLRSMALGLDVDAVEASWDGPALASVPASVPKPTPPGSAGEAAASSGGGPGETAPSSSDLLLSVLTDDGRVHIYEVLSILKCHAKDNKSRFCPSHAESNRVAGNVSADNDDDALWRGFAAFILGDDLNRRVQESVVPLSRPLASVPLSPVAGVVDGAALAADSAVSGAPDGSAGYRWVALDDTLVGDDDELENDGDALLSPVAAVVEIEEAPVRAPFLDLSSFDARVDPDTVRYRTSHNVPTLCAHAFDFVAVGGTGVRRKRRKVSRQRCPSGRRKTTARGGSCGYPTSCEGDQIAVIGPDKGEDGISRDPGRDTGVPWLDATNGIGPSTAGEGHSVHARTDVKEAKIAVAENTAAKDIKSTYSDANDIPGSASFGATTKKATTTWVWEDYDEPGGFVTLVSLYHYSEAKTVYLPFEPKQLSPVVWNCMHFIVILGEGLRQSHSSSQINGKHPMAVAVRVDSARVSAPLCDEKVATTASQTSFDSASSHTGSDSPVQAVQPSAFVTPPPYKAQGKQQTEYKKERKTRPKCYPRRYISLPIILPIEEGPFETSSMNVSALTVTSMLASPPGIAISYSDASKGASVLLTNHTFRGFYYLSQNIEPEAPAPRPRLVIGTVLQPEHMARIPSVCGGRSNADKSPQVKAHRKTLTKYDPEMWCSGGQGWSIVGTGLNGVFSVFFVCWEGATASHGAYVVEMSAETKLCCSSATRKLQISPVVFSDVMPTDFFVVKGRPFERKSKQGTDGLSGTSPVQLPFTSPYTLPSFLKGESSAVHLARHTSMRFLAETARSPGDVEAGVDDIVIDALGSITSPGDERMPSIGANQRRRGWMNITHLEKSRRLLKHCSSWTQLDDTEENRALIDGQVVVATIRFGTQRQHQQSLTLRRNVIANGIATPFHQVLAWLCQGKDYYTAASIALNLLNDVEAVRDLRGSPSNDVDEHERSYLQGLLDGILPLEESDFLEFLPKPPVKDSPDRKISLEVSDHKQPLHGAITSLADMAVGCLIRGGTSMSRTLNGFLGRNEHYDASRACLMLVASIATAMSEHEKKYSEETLRDIAPSEHKDITLEIVEAQRDAPGEDVLWPIRCLLRIAVTRECMPTALLLLNATIPHELRWRVQKGHVGLGSLSQRPPLGLCLSVVSMIVASCEYAAGYLLALVDEDTEMRFWKSLGHDSRLAMSLIAIRGKYPMLREAEVRAWAIEQLEEAVRKSAGFVTTIHGMEAHNLSSEWLRGLVRACFSNAGSGIDLLVSAASPISSQGDLTSSVLNSDAEDDGLDKYKEEAHMMENALMPSAGSGGLDFDLLIPALLLLQKRSVQWSDGVSMSTQSILVAACALAGRKHSAVQEPIFTFDGSAVMRQCALVGNVQAVGSLIGGQDGLVLECADVLINFLGLSMEKAEKALLRGSLNGITHIVRAAPLPHPALDHSLMRFELTDGHRTLLRLMEYHVLSVRTYGQFGSGRRGRVDPVFAARVCLRGWFCLMRGDIDMNASDWLAAWLRCRLEIRPDGGISKKRLACAALARALLWPDESDGADDNPPLLGERMGFKCDFLVELAQACCGLVESVPSYTAEELMAGVYGYGSDELEQTMARNALEW